ncbi:membrane-associated progesterone receptor component 1 [Drosophila bipectinata]|uniref:membrane-associated progesterone receptor component 1 n=1 Tax=Drosophila bipectinata TaxID=42026 RepID=UPI001C894F1D|nr:membrane-associated progesterone receptor component 1 [Drosophila bipectinata]
MAVRAKMDEQASPWYSSFYNSIKQTPTNVTLLVVSAIVFYKVVSLTRRRRLPRDQKALGSNPISSDIKSNRDCGLPALHSDFTVGELREFDGSRHDGRILVAINFNVYDVSNSPHYYGPHGVYPNYAGRDISRNLINFSVESNESADFDDLSDLSIGQMNILREWDQQYSEKYPYVGKLLRDGIPHTNYADEETDEYDEEDKIEDNEDYKMDVTALDNEKDEVNNKENNVDNVEDIVQNFVDENINVNEEKEDSNTNENGEMDNENTHEENQNI